MNPIPPFPDQTSEHTDNVPRVVPYTWTSGGEPVPFSTVSSWSQGHVACDPNHQRGVFIVAINDPDD